MADIMTPVSEIERIFHLQKEHQFQVARSTATERIAKLKKIIKAVGTDYKDDIREACYKDLRKSHFEVDMTEIYPVLTEARQAVRHLRSWMKGEKVPTPMVLTGSTSWVHHEPKGVCLIMSPWNFPFNITFVPLVSAIAAGNTVVLKPSEMSPAVSQLMFRIVSELFDEREVALIQGGIDTSAELLKQPFNHIFFTGSPNIGKVVMRAAAEHLTSVTLELGGKSPTIIDDTADIKTAARRTVFLKFLNSGQICIAPDYIFVHESKKEEFIMACRHYITEFYGEDPKTSSGYARIINDRHFDRVVSYIEETIEKGGNIVFGGKWDRDQKYISPTLVEGAPQDSLLMQEEIFGPVLPVMAFRNLSEPVDYLKSREKPLALYIYSQSQKNIDYLIGNTRAGGTTVNHSGIHFSNHHLPFGGDNNSGMGKCHGIYGFKEFSNERSIYKQNLPSVLDILSPPYNGWKQKLVDLTLKWF